MEVNTYHHLTPGDGQTSNLLTSKKNKTVNYLINKHITSMALQQLPATSYKHVKAFANPLC